MRKRFWSTAVVITSLLITIQLTPARAQSPEPDATGSESASNETTISEPEGVETLLRGPVHEAFAEPLNLDPEDALTIPKEPPKPIEEVPPEIASEEGHIWIAGYWAWDEEREDFIWVSGVWRKPPQGRTWVPGQWIKTDDGYRWVAGYWNGGATDDDPNFLPTPPETLEQGPTSAQPSENHFWVPGTWSYRQSRYVWRPGFWSPCHDNWVWVPEHYVWRPSGCVHVAGYWDYDWRYRGTLFAPCYISRGLYYGVAGYRYRPSVVISFGSLFNHLWIRPGYRHYYFGDYYGAGYSRYGFVPWYNYHRVRRYYDPLFVYHRWTHRHTHRNLHNHYHNLHNHYRRNAGSRPPRTFVEHERFRTRDGGRGNARNTVVARRVDEAVRARNQARSFANKATLSGNRRRAAELTDAQRRRANPRAVSGRPQNGQAGTRSRTAGSASAVRNQRGMAGNRRPSGSTITRNNGPRTNNAPTAANSSRTGATRPNRQQILGNLTNDARRLQAGNGRRTMTNQNGNANSSIGNRARTFTNQSANPRRSSTSSNANRTQVARPNFQRNSASQGNVQRRASSTPRPSSTSSARSSNSGSRARTNSNTFRARSSQPSATARPRPSAARSVPRSTPSRAQVRSPQPRAQVRSPQPRAQVRSSQPRPSVTRSAPSRSFSRPTPQRTQTRSAPRPSYRAAPRSAPARISTPSRAPSRSFSRPSPSRAGGGRSIRSQMQSHPKARRMSGR